MNIRNAISFVALMLAMVGCGSSVPNYYLPSAKTHVVRSGETLAGIAQRYGMNYRNLARWNGLGDGSLIYPGQTLHLTAPPGGSVQARAPRPAAKQQKPLVPPPEWTWPTSGRIVSEFRGGADSGLLIAGKTGQPVRAAAAGKVVYSGGGLIGYGQLIIVKHNDTYLSAYGHNAELLVREGQTISRGQRIATMGQGPGKGPRLHFEIRQNGKPVNPRRFLPTR